MKKIYVILSLVLSVCFLVGSAQASPFNFDPNLAAKKVLGGLVEWWVLEIASRAETVQKPKNVAETRPAFYDRLTEIQQTSPVWPPYRNSAWKNKVVSNFQAHTNLKQLEEMLKEVHEVVEELLRIQALDRQMRIEENKDRDMFRSMFAMVNPLLSEWLSERRGGEGPSEMEINQRALAAGYNMAWAHVSFSPLQESTKDIESLYKARSDLTLYLNAGEDHISDQRWRRTFGDQ